MYTEAVKFLDDRVSSGHQATELDRAKLAEWWESERKRIKDAGGTIVETHHPAGSRIARWLSNLFGLPE